MSASGSYLPKGGLADEDVPFASELPKVDVPLFTFVPLSEFVAVDKPGAAALLGEGEDALIPEGGDVMIYGDGGAGKTTIAVDVGCHLAAGDAWLEIQVARPLNVALIENEGPRPQFRAKLRRKCAGWQGGPLGDRLSVLERPWSTLTLANPVHRQAFADALAALQTDVAILGPVTRLGMNEAGTLQEVRDFAALLDDVRRLAGRPVTFVLIHRAIRDRLLAGGRLVNSGGKGGMKLWHPDDPACPAEREQLRPEGDALGDAPASDTGDTGRSAATASLRPDVEGTQGAGTHPGSPDDTPGNRAPNRDAVEAAPS